MEKAQPGRRPTLVGSDINYIVVSWELLDSLRRPNDLIEIYHLKDGATALTLKAPYGARKLCIAKSSFHRLGLAMPSLENVSQYETTIYDLKNGQKIISLKEFGFNKVAHFELKRDKIHFQREQCTVQTF